MKYTLTGSGMMVHQVSKLHKIDSGKESVYNSTCNFAVRLRLLKQLNLFITFQKCNQKVSHRL